VAQGRPFDPGCPRRVSVIRPRYRFVVRGVTVGVSGKLATYADVRRMAARVLERDRVAVEDAADAVAGNSHRLMRWHARVDEIGEVPALRPPPSAPVNTCVDGR